MLRARPTPIKQTQVLEENCGEAGRGWTAQRERAALLYSAQHAAWAAETKEGDPKAAPLIGVGSPAPPAPIRLTATSGPWSVGSMTNFSRKTVVPCGWRYDYRPGLSIFQRLSRAISIAW